MTTTINPQTALIPNWQIENNLDSKDKLYNALIGTTGAVVGYEADYYLGKLMKKPINKILHKEIPKLQGYNFKENIKLAIKQNKLEDSFKVLDLNPNTIEEVKKKTDIKLEKPNGISRFIGHILRLPISDDIKTFNDTVQGRQAFFDPKSNAVVCNLEKFGSPIFHEITHKLNDTSQNPLIKTLAKIRNPLGVFVPTIISAIAVCTNPEEKNSEKKKGFTEFVKKHCGLLTAGALLPLTIEECIANIKGTQVAIKAGVTGEALKNVKKCHKLSIISYCSKLIITSLAVHCGSKLRDYICSKRKDIKKQAQ